MHEQVYVYSHHIFLYYPILTLLSGLHVNVTSSDKFSIITVH